MMPTTDGTTVLAGTLVPPRASRLDALLTRLGLSSVVARDGVLTVVVLVVTLGLFALALSTEDLTVGPVQGVVLVVAACLQVLPLALRRVRPVLSLGMVVALQAIIAAASPPDLSVGGIPTLIAAYTVGTLLPTRRALTLAGAAAPVGAMAAAVTSVVWGHDPLMPFVNHLAAGVVLYVVSAFVGTTVATRRSNASLIHLRAAELVRTQQAQTRAAIFAERSRMARELHDVAAHHLSGLVVQAAAVERQIDSDPESAKEGTAWIRAQGKETLDSLRLIVGVLRERPGTDGEQGADAHDAPPPGLGALEGLVRTARTLGDTVELVREGRARDLPPIADAAFYRVAQESLSNARQHAPEAPVRVTVRFDEREVSLEVVNGPAPGGTRSDPSRQGMGLIGMRERAQLVGATLITGATQSGGWRVLLTLPLHHG